VLIIDNIKLQHPVTLEHKIKWTIDVCYYPTTICWYAYWCAPNEKRPWSQLRFFMGFLSPSWQKLGECLKFGYSCFRPYPFQFVTTPYHFKLQSMKCW
jgi:hypothetical protein